MTRRIDRWLAGTNHRKATVRQALALPQIPKNLWILVAVVCLWANFPTANAQTTEMTFGRLMSIFLMAGAGAATIQ